MSIEQDLLKIKKNLPEKVRLVAVSKTKSYQEILEAYHAGQRIFGENKVQELVDKHEHLPGDIEWHFIGHLQTNKVKYLAGFVDLLHGVDSLKLLSVINKEAGKAGRIIDCLLQIKIAQEESKFGLPEQGAITLLESADFHQLKNVRITGLMGMATYTPDMGLVRDEFRKLNSIFNSLQKTYFREDDSFKELSMGMSHDYQVAIGEGATLVRIGSLLFGERVYNK